MHFRPGASPLLGISLIGARSLAGYLMDRLFAPYVAAAFLLVPVLGVVALAWPSSTADLRNGKGRELHKRKVLTNDKQLFETIDSMIRTIF